MKISFGKSPIFTCSVKQQSNDTNSKNKNKVHATLYKLEKNSPSDANTLFYSRTGRKLYRDFVRISNRINYADYYILQNDDTDEIISAAKTSRYYRYDDNNEGTATLINELYYNSAYENGEEPMLAGIVKSANDVYDTSVVSALDTDELPILEQTKFKRQENGVWSLPQTDFKAVTKKAEKNFHIDYFI